MNELFRSEGNDFSDIKKLDLAYSRLTEIPDISSFSSLETLDLTNTRINDISSLESITTLKELYLRHFTVDLDKLVDYKKLPRNLEKIIYSKRSSKEVKVEISKEQINARRVSS